MMSQHRSFLLAGLILFGLLSPLETYATHSEDSLFSATSAGDLEGVQAAVQNGASVNARQNVDIGKTRTALHIAAFKGYDNIVAYLLAQGAEVDARDENDETALHISARQGHTGIVLQLLARGADVFARSGSSSQRGASALIIAAEAGHKQVTSVLKQEIIRRKTGQAGGVKVIPVDTPPKDLDASSRGEPIPVGSSSSDTQSETRAAREQEPERTKDGVKRKDEL